MDERTKLYNKKKNIEKLSNKIVVLLFVKIKKEISKKQKNWLLPLYAQFNNNYVDYFVPIWQEINSINTQDECSLPCKDTNEGLPCAPCITQRVD